MKISHDKYCYPVTTLLSHIFFVHENLNRLYTLRGRGMEVPRAVRLVPHRYEVCLALAPHLRGTRPSSAPPFGIDASVLNRGYHGRQNWTPSENRNYRQHIFLVTHRMLKSRPDGSW